jgi:hypothetical protein
MGFLASFNWDAVDWPAAITNALLVGILIELVQINGKVGRK